MEKLLALGLVLGAVISCRDPLFDSLPRYMREHGRTLPSSGGGAAPKDTAQNPSPQEPPAPPEPSVYVTAFHYIDTENWETDSLGAAELLFFKDQELLLRLPVETPPDPERHRIWDGRLWTDATDGFLTRVFRDGEEMFRYDGQEQLRGFLIKDGEVHTLGQHPGRDGLCYRIDGREVFSFPKGTLLGSPSDPEWESGALTLDEGWVYFTYKADGNYWVMQDSKYHRVVSERNADAFYDFRVKDGDVLQAYRKGTVYYLKTGNQEKALNVSGSMVVSCKLVPVGNKMVLRGVSRVSDEKFLYWYFDSDSAGIRNPVSGKSARCGMVLQEDGWLFADTQPDGTVCDLLLSGEKLDMPEGTYYLATPQCLFYKDGHYAAAFSGRNGSKPTVVYDGKALAYSFNGYFTSVKLQ